MKHHPCSPSTLGRRYRCPGSLREERDLPDTSTADAKVGTAVHEWVAEAIAGNAEVDDAPEDIRELVEKCVRFFSSTAPLGAQTYVEQLLWVFDDDRQSLTFGTADAVVLHDREVSGFDWKSGFLDLDEDDATLQSAPYLVGALQKFDADRGKWRFYMPRTGRVYELELTRDEIPEAVAKIRAIIERAEQPDAPLVAGEHCRYCRALGICAATRETVEHVGDLVALAEPPKTKAAYKAAIKDEVKRWPAKRVEAVLNDPRFEVARMAIDAVRARARECLEQDPGCIDGWSLKDKNLPRSADAQELWRHLISDDRHNVWIDNYLTCCTVSVNKVENLVGEEKLEELNGVIRQGTTQELRKARKKVTT